jgi:hypothetical protein
MSAAWTSTIVACRSAKAASHRPAKFPASNPSPEPLSIRHRMVCLKLTPRTICKKCDPVAEKFQKQDFSNPARAIIPTDRIMPIAPPIRSCVCRARSNPAFARPRPAARSLGFSLSPPHRPRTASPTKERRFDTSLPSGVAVEHTGAGSGSQMLCTSAMYTLSHVPTSEL